MWLWVAGLAGIASATDSFLNRLALKESDKDVSSYTLIYFLLISLFLLIFAFPLDLYAIVKNWQLVAWQGVFWSMASACGYFAKVKTHVSIQSLIGQTRIFWVTFLAVFLLGEILTVQTILAIFIIFLGLTLLFLQKDFDWHGGIVLSLLASIFAAAGAIANTILVRGSLGVMTVSFTMVASQLPLLFVLFLFYKSNADGFGEILTLGVLKETIGYGRRRNLLKDVLKAKWKLLVGATIMESIAVAGVNWSYRGGPSSMATTVFMSFSVITTVIFGYVFLNERKYFLRKIISGTIIIAGILVLKFVSL